MQPDEQLRPAFLSQLQGLQSRVYTLAPPKVLQGRELSGANLASLARSYASQINGGAIPTMTDMFEHMAASQCKQSKADAWAQFEKDMAAIADAIPLSAEVRYAPSVVPLLLACWSHGFTHPSLCWLLQELAERVMQVRDAAISAFRNGSLGSPAQATQEEALRVRLSGAAPTAGRHGNDLTLCPVPRAEKHRRERGSCTVQQRSQVHCRVHA